VVQNLDGKDVGRLRESIRLLARKLGFLDKAEASCCGVTFSQCHALVEIGRAGSISVNELADLLGLDKSTMSRTVNNLVEQGLVTRELDPGDRRYVRIGLTEGGRKVFSRIESGMSDYFQSVYNNIPETKRAQVLESLEILLWAMTDRCC